LTKLEQKIQKNILDYINSMPYSVAWKVVVANERGVPDIVACINGNFVGIEVKREGETQTPIQEAQLERIRKAKGIGVCVTSVDSVSDAIKEIF